LTVATVGSLESPESDLAELTNKVGEKKSDAVREHEEAAVIAAKLEEAKLVCAQLEQAKQAAEARPQNEQEQGDAVAAVAVSARPDAAAHVAGEALVSKEPGGRQFEFRFHLTMVAVFI
jgi:ethanolamine utilization cobalamin adenosyltransferase